MIALEIELLVNVAQMSNIRRKLALNALVSILKWVKYLFIYYFWLFPKYQNFVFAMAKMACQYFNICPKFRFFSQYFNNLAKISTFSQYFNISILPHSLDIFFRISYILIFQIILYFFSGSVGPTQGPVTPEIGGPPVMWWIWLVIGIGVLLERLRNFPNFFFKFTILINSKSFGYIFDFF